MSRRSSISPTSVISAAAPRIPRISVVAGRNSAPATSTPAKIARPPSSGVRLGREPALLDGIERADAAREPRDERRDGRRQRERDEEGEQRAFFHGYRRGSQGIRWVMLSFDAPSVLPALLTPFDERGEIDAARARATTSSS